MKDRVIQNTLFLIPDRSTVLKAHFKNLLPLINLAKHIFVAFILNLCKYQKQRADKGFFAENRSPCKKNRGRNKVLFCRSHS